MFSEFFSLSRLSAGLVAVMVGYTSSAVIIFQAASAAGADSCQINSWLWALGIGMAVTSIGLSVRYRSPILTAWSTPGAALLVTGLSGVTINEAIGAFLFCSLLIALCGFCGIFERLMHHIPNTLAAAMLAGILVPFGLDLFLALKTQSLLVGTMLVTYLLTRKISPRYVILLSLGAGLVIASMNGLVNTSELSWQLASPQWMAPSFNPSVLVGVGIPLFIVTMASQNMPGIAILHAHGYHKVPTSPLIGWTGATGLLLAPFGGFAFNLAAITAAICMGKEADPNPDKRYFASVWAGIFYLITGLFGATVAAAFSALPIELVAAIAGLALLGTISNSIATAVSDETGREAAIITFLITASGISLFGIGSAFWGLMAGLLVNLSKPTNS
ncbi:MAG: benzoate/H(+) symporter BenE family transporter [Motiliproteus sp.]|nr:benzoate/H(+) symporter BenE family transporter [Motiliproteus sp.]MCW9053570.1 benzoate/H(+) symporter BenE family transporter [Motiliproteus sp.]